METIEIATTELTFEDRSNSDVPTSIQPSSAKQTLTCADHSVAEVLLQYLEKMDIPFVFGIPGGFIAPFLKVLRRSNHVSFIIGRQETGCAFIADGFARMTGKPGVVFVTSGPGALNALTGVACAHKGRSSVMLISGQNPTSHYGMGALQEATSDGVNIVEIFRHACASSELIINAKVLKTRLLQASRLCLGKPRQAVHLSFPLDISASKFENNVELPESKNAYVLASGTADHAKLQLALQVLVRAQNPLILLGSGCREALRGNSKRLYDFTRLLSSLAIPIVTSLQGKGLFPESHPLSLGVHGISGSKLADAFVQEMRPDVVLVIGSSLSEWVTKSWDSTWVPDRVLIHIDIDPRMIGRVYPAQLGIVGEAGASLDCLIENGRQVIENTFVDLVQRRKERISDLKSRVSRYSKPERRNCTTGPLLPQRLMVELNELIPEKTSIFLDNGNCIGWGIHHLQIDPPVEIYLSTAMASMGWANGAVIGAKLGANDRTCICVTGDGSFLMSGAEVSTAARYKVGAIWIILYDNSLGMVNHGEMVTGNYEYPLEDSYYALGNPDIVGFAKSLGADAYWIEKAGELKEIFPQVLERANGQGRPQVIAAKIDPHELAPILDRFESLKRSGA